MSQLLKQVLRTWPSQPWSAKDRLPPSKKAIPIIGKRSPSLLKSACPFRLRLAGHPIGGLTFGGLARAGEMRKHSPVTFVRD